MFQVSTNAYSRIFWHIWGEITILQQKISPWNIETERDVYMFHLHSLVFVGRPTITLLPSATVSFSLFLTEYMCHYHTSKHISPVTHTHTHTYILSSFFSLTGVWAYSYNQPPPILCAHNRRLSQSTYTWYIRAAQSAGKFGQWPPSTQSVLYHTIPCEIYLDHALTERREKREAAVTGSMKWR